MVGGRLFQNRVFRLLLAASRSRCMDVVEEPGEEAVAPARYFCCCAAAAARSRMSEKAPAPWRPKPPPEEISRRARVGWSGSASSVYQREGRVREEGRNSAPGAMAAPGGRRTPWRRISRPLERREDKRKNKVIVRKRRDCLLYTSPSPRDRQKSRMPSSA